MSIPFNATLSGTFSSDGVSKLITVPSDIVKFEVFNETQFGSAAAATPMIQASWIKDLPVAGAYLGAKTNGAATIAITQMITADGFTLIDPTSVAPGAAVATTAVTAANPAVASTASTTGLIAGSTVVRMINVAAMQQISGMDFTVGTIVANTSFQLKFLDASGFAAAGTTGFYRILPSLGPYYPKRRFITKISKAASAVITMSVVHQFTVGQLVRIYVPSAFGMTQMNGQQATITAISVANNTITVDIDSTAFTTFAFPTSAVAATGVTFAQVVPIGEAATSPYQNLLDDATVNQSAYQMSIGSSVVGGNADVIRWIAYRAVSQ